MNTEREIARYFGSDGVWFYIPKRELTKIERDLIDRGYMETGVDPITGTPRWRMKVSHIQTLGQKSAKDVTKSKPIFQGGAP